MTADTVKIIITAEVGDQKAQLGSMVIRVDEKLDESIYRGTQSTGKRVSCQVKRESKGTGMDGSKEKLTEVLFSFLKV
jgi:hypothetical protein